MVNGQKLVIDGTGVYFLKVESEDYFRPVCFIENNLSPCLKNQYPKMMIKSSSGQFYEVEIEFNNPWKRENTENQSNLEGFNEDQNTDNLKYKRSNNGKRYLAEIPLSIPLYVSNCVPANNHICNEVILNYFLFNI